MTRLLRKCAILLSLLVPVSASAADVINLEQPGTLISCFFEQPRNIKLGIGIYIPATGVKDKAVLPAQIRNPDGLLSADGFDHVQIKDGITLFTGKDRMEITFLGGEIYHAILRGEGNKKYDGTCVVSSDSGLSSAMKDFDGFRDSVIAQGKDTSHNQ